MSRTRYKKNLQVSETQEDKPTITVTGNTRLEYVETTQTNKTAQKSSPTNSTITKIVAEVDIGFGNTLYIRGAGKGLSWDKGVALKNQDTNFWVLELPGCKEDFEYKLLINDDTWSTGENFVAHHGTNNIISPNF